MCKVRECSASTARRIGLGSPQRSVCATRRRSSLIRPARWRRAGSERSLTTSTRTASPSTSAPRDSGTRHGASTRLARQRRLRATPTSTTGSTGADTRPSGSRPRARWRLRAKRSRRAIPRSGRSDSSPSGSIRRTTYCTSVTTRSTSADPPHRGRERDRPTCFCADRRLNRWTSRLACTWRRSRGRIEPALSR